MLDLNRISSINGWMNNEELQWLYDTASGMGSVLEIGAWCGRSTFALCSGCPGMVFSIDHFRGSLEHEGMIKGGMNPIAIYYENMKGFGNIITVIGESATVSKHIAIEYDMLFIDGAHEKEAIEKDLVSWALGAKRIVAGHDWGYGQIREAVHAFYPGEEIKEGPGSIWWIRRGE